jgi:hypothetical protein
MKTITMIANANELPVDHVGCEIVESGSIEELQVLQLTVANAYEQCESGNSKVILANWGARIAEAIKDAQFERDRLPY